LDIERFLTMVALEVIQCHWDGYTMNRNNYRLYHDKDSGKMIFMPHGMDQMFGSGGSRHGSSPNGSIIPPLNGFVSGAVLGTTEGRTRYLEKLAVIRTNIFVVEEVTSRVRELDKRIRPYARASYSRRWSTADELIQNIVERGESIDRQLEGLPKPAEFTNGIFRPNGWPKRNGNGLFEMAMSKDGKKLLHITANGQSSASWRTSAVLPIGSYKFEGYTRTRGAGSGEHGAHLRISGAVATPVLHGDTEWVMLSFPFEVTEPTREVELVCELKGPQGEAWFDTTTLKIRQVK
jgi:hypothetical protein